MSWTASWVGGKLVGGWVILADLADTGEVVAWCGWRDDERAEGIANSRLEATEALTHFLGMDEQGRIWDQRARYEVEVELDAALAEVDIDDPAIPRVSSGVQARDDGGRR